MKSLPPSFAGGPPFRAREEVLERHMQEGAASLGEDLPVESEVAVDVDAASAALRDPRGDRMWRELGNIL